MRSLLFLLLLFLTLPFSAQNSKKVKAMQREKTQLEEKIRKTTGDLNKTRSQVKTGQQNVNFLGVQMSNRLERIQDLEKDLNVLDANIVSLQKELTQIDGELRNKRAQLRAAMLFARTQRECHDPLIFVLSAHTVNQMFRRARYAREFVTYERTIGQQILEKQNQQLAKQSQLLSAKSRMNETLTEIMQQRKALSEQQVREQKKVAGLKKQESGLASQVKEQQKQLNALDKKIEALIAYEIEQARKAAEEAARKKREAEEAARKKKQKGGSSAPAPSKGDVKKPAPSTKGSSGNWLTPEDRMLSGSFEQNKGRLPVPITGQYMKAGHFGIYNVPGMKNVQLDNKGTNYVGRPGARARSVFDGVVTSVFQFGGTRNVLVRHGSYISVYCNLSSVIVSKGQKVKARDILGSVADDGSGNCTLHFQLRKETAKLNPEAWVGK